MLASANILQICNVVNCVRAVCRIHLSSEMERAPRQLCGRLRRGYMQLHQWFCMHLDRLASDVHTRKHDGRPCGSHCRNRSMSHAIPATRSPPQRQQTFFLSGICMAHLYVGVECLCNSHRASSGRAQADRVGTRCMKIIWKGCISSWVGPAHVHSFKQAGKYVPS